MRRGHPSPGPVRRAWLRRGRTAGVAAVLILASHQTACDGGAARGGHPAGAPMTPSGMPLAHMDTSRTVTAMARGARADLCAVGTGAADGRAEGAEPRITLVADAASATGPTRVPVEVAAAPAPGAGVGAELVVDARVHASCAGMELMIAGPGVGMPGSRLRLTSPGPVIVVARTTDGRPLAGPVRLAPGVRGAVLQWGDRQP